MKQQESLAKLVKQWAVDTTSYRLIAVAKWSSGYTDIYVLERATKDALGGDNWAEVQRWDTQDKRSTFNILAAGL